MENKRQNIRINPQTGRPFTKKKNKKNGLQWSKERGTYRDDGATQIPKNVLAVVPKT